MNKVLSKDAILNMAALFIVLLYLVLPLIKKAMKEDEGQKPPGNITALATWSEGNTDIDLWVTGPGELYPIGYSNKGGLLWNLLRDDLGTSPDATPLNYENAYTRGAPAGEYIINVHCYRCPVLPQKVSVEIGSSQNVTEGKGTVVLATATVELKANGQEKTAVRFKLDGEGKIVPGSLNGVFKELRAAGKSDMGRPQ